MAVLVASVLETVPRPVRAKARAVFGCSPQQARGPALSFKPPVVSLALEKLGSSRHAGSRLTVCAVAGGNGERRPKQDEDSRPAEPTELARLRARRLEVLVSVRKLYRSAVRCNSQLQLPEPLYNESEDAELEHATKASPPPAASQSARRGRRRNRAAAADSGEQGEEALRKAADAIMDMRECSRELQDGLRGLRKGFGCVFFSGLADTEAQREAEEKLMQQVQDLQEQLQSRIERETSRLPREAMPLLSSPGTDAAVPDGSSGPIRSLEQAEKAAETFVVKRLQPAVRKVKETGLAKSLKDGSTYVKGVWDRLNGGGRTPQRHLPKNFPTPTSSAALGQDIGPLTKEIAALEKRLVDVSKEREGRLRKAGIGARAQLTFALRGMDEEVLDVSRRLAVRTLQLQMEFLYQLLEEEVLQVLDEGAGSSSWMGGGGAAAEATGYDAALAMRRGSSEELALLIAEFRLLDSRLAELATVVDQSGELALLSSFDGALANLATDIPDMRSRLGIPDQEVFGGPGPSLRKVQLQAVDTMDKLTEGVNFFSRGMRLMGSDITNAGTLFSKAALGASLKPREVLALRRTARDILTFVPFTAILITPLTPVGHVLVFGFIQRYFPGLFPSQFSTQRQDIMVRYEQLREKLRSAQETATQEAEEAEYARAAAAVARLTAPALPDDDDDSDDGSDSAGKEGGKQDGSEAGGKSGSASAASSAQPAASAAAPAAAPAATATVAAAATPPAARSSAPAAAAAAAAAAAESQRAAAEPEPRAERAEGKAVDLEELERLVEEAHQLSMTGTEEDWADDGLSDRQASKAPHPG